MESLSPSAISPKSLASPAGGPISLLVVSEKGIGKQTEISQFPVQKRAGSGVKAMEISAKTGSLVTARTVDDKIDQIILTSAKGIVIKLPLISVPKLSRATKGVILMRFSDSNDKLAAVATLEK
jgi:DNA gyrase subunit A